MNFSGFDQEKMRQAIARKNDGDKRTVRIIYLDLGGTAAEYDRWWNVRHDWQNIEERNRQRAKRRLERQRRKFEALPDIGRPRERTEFEKAIIMARELPDDKRIRCTYSKHGSKVVQGLIELRNRYAAADRFLVSMTGRFKGKASLPDDLEVGMAYLSYQAKVTLSQMHHQGVDGRRYPFIKVAQLRLYAEAAYRELNG